MLLTFHPYLVNTLGIIVIDSRKSKTIGLYTNYTEIDYKSRVQQTME